MKIEGAIFDLDGTLTDSMYIWDRVPKMLVRKFGAEPPEELAQDIKAFGRREASEYLVRRFRLNCTTEEYMEAINEASTDEYKYVVDMKPGVDRLLEKLSEKGVPCGIATASEAFQAQYAMERLGLWGHFKFAISTLQYGPKTDAGIYLEASKLLGSAPEHTVVFEDAIHACKTAKDAGFLIAGVYDASSGDSIEEMKRLCDWYLPRLDEENFINMIE